MQYKIPSHRPADLVFCCTHRTSGLIYRHRVAGDISKLGLLVCYCCPKSFFCPFGLKAAAHTLTLSLQLDARNASAN